MKKNQSFRAFRKKHEEKEGFSDEIIEKLGFFEENLKKAIKDLNPKADFSLNSSEKTVFLNNIPQISEIMATESFIDQGLLACMVSLSRISNEMKQKALKTGVFL